MTEAGLAPVAIIGIHGGRPYGNRAAALLAQADVIIGSTRQLDALDADLPGTAVALWGRLDEVLELAEQNRSEGRRVCILASGDPGFFGLARLASARLGPEGIEVHPAPSSVALAFARLGLNWDDAVVASAHGRPLAEAVNVVLRHSKVAVLVSPDQPPERLGQALVEAGCGSRIASVCSRLGEAEEGVHTTDLAGLASGCFDPMSVVVLRAPQPRDDAMGLAWGLPETDFAHRGGMITKAEVRAVALGKLSLPAAGVLWDLGAGSGSVAVECARLRPGLRIFAVEREPDAVADLKANVGRDAITVVQGEAPACLEGLADPDRVFIGGGGLAVLDAALARLRPGGTVVATYALLDRAVAAAQRLGSLVQVSVARGRPLGDGLHLAAENPVFVCWGPG